MPGIGWKRTPLIFAAVRRRVLHRAGIVVFAGEHEQARAVGVDTADAIARIPVAGIEADVAVEHGGAALGVVPDDVLGALGRALRGDQAADPFGNEVRLVDLGVGGERGLAAFDALGGFAGDDAGESVRVAVGEFEADLA